MFVRCSPPDYTSWQKAASLSMRTVREISSVWKLIAWTGSFADCIFMGSILWKQLSGGFIRNIPYDLLGRKHNLRTSFRDAFAACNVAFARKMFQISFRELSWTNVTGDFCSFALVTTGSAFTNHCVPGCNKSIYMRKMSFRGLSQHTH